MISVDHQWAYLQHDDISVGSGNVNLTTTLNVVTYCSINQIARKQVCFFYVPSMISGCTFKDNSPVPQHLLRGCHIQLTKVSTMQELRCSVQAHLLYNWVIKRYIKRKRRVAVPDPIVRLPSQMNEPLFTTIPPGPVTRQFPPADENVVFVEAR